MHPRRHALLMALTAAASSRRLEALTAAASSRRLGALTAGAALVPVLSRIGEPAEPLPPLTEEEKQEA